MTRRRLLAAASLGPAAALGAAPAAQARRPVSDPDVSAFDALLQRYVRTDSEGINRVDYHRWQATTGDRRALARVVADLQRTDPGGLDRAQQIAFWSNLYNAETLRVVLEAYPVGSILAIRPTFLSIGPWKARTLRVAGRELSLDEVENRILRPMGEPLVHYALNCASKGCPNLPPRAWRAESLADELRAAARAYVNHPRGVRVTPRGLVLSSIYKWYRVDFGGDAAGVLSHLERFASPKLADVLSSRPQILGYDYDWRLNDATASPR